MKSNQPKTVILSTEGAKDLRFFASLRMTVVIILLCFLFIQCLIFAKENGQTVDEPFYSAIGYPIARYGTYKILGEHPPLLTHLAALPLLFVQPEYPIDNPVRSSSGGIDPPHTGLKFLYEMGNNADQIIFLQRIPIILITVLFAAVLFLWAKDLYGAMPAIVALSFFSFCPNILAHGSLNTTDLGAAAFFFFALYRLRKFLLKPTVRNMAMLGILSGLALLTKISTLVLIPVSFVLFILSIIILRPRTPVILSTEGAKDLENIIIVACLTLMILSAGQKIMLIAVYPLCLTLLLLFWQKRHGLGLLNRVHPKIALLLYLIAWGVSLVSAILLFKKTPNLAKLALVLNLGTLAIHYFLKRKPLSASHAIQTNLFLSIWVIALFVIIFGYVDFTANLIRLKPFKHYVQNFMMVVGHSDGGHHSCFPGSFVTCDWKYFPSLLLIKLPVGTLLSFLLGLALLFKTQISRLDKMFLLIPTLSFLLTAATASQIHIGIRHALILFPFIFLIAGVPFDFIVRHCEPRRGEAISKTGLLRRYAPRNDVLRFIPIILFLLPLATAVESLANFPHHISFFNAFVGGAEQGAKLTGDSNFNWGQDNRRMIQYVLDHKFPQVKILNVTRNAEAYDYHKVPWMDLPVAEYPHPKPSICIVDVQYYQKFQNEPGNWFVGKPPRAKIGKTLYLFEVT